ncbi:hypothetical protein D046_7202A, partial [Vibrio parahaemolyticus V-223/04]
MKNRVLYNSVF